MTNPLLTDSVLPHFTKIEPDHVFPAVQQVLTEYRQTVENILSATHQYTWDNLCQPLEEASDKLSRVWSPVGHLHSVKNSPELREAYEKCLPLLSEFSTWMGQHEPLYLAYKSLKDSAQFASLSQSQKNRLKIRCATSNCQALVYHLKNNSATVKLLPVCQKSPLNSATMSLMRQWAGPN